jgi:glycosyltransferase involved in cell wall biosynthesis
VTLDIMVPFWGDPALLRATVASVLAQTDPDWRLVVVDDAYPDPTVAEYFATLGDDRVEYHRNEVNRGITDNYRRCVELATAEHLVLLGCDDLLHPGYVAVVRAALAAHPGVDVVQPGVEVVDENGQVTRTLVDYVKRTWWTPRGPRVLRGEALAASLLQADWLYWPSLVFRRETLARTGFRDGLAIIQDLAIVIDVVCHDGTLLVVPDVCFSYRRHSASASSSKLYDGSRFRGEREYFALAAAQVAARGWPRAVRAARWHVTSRLHALVLLPGVLVRGDLPAVRALAGHVVNRAVWKTAAGSRPS